MKIIKSFKILKDRINHIKNIGFVPTMGSLHNGHLSLIKKAKIKSQKVLVSIFLNPSQFNERKDFIKYPRNIRNDISKLENLKVDYLFLPSNTEIYKSGIKRKINIQKKDKILCAKYRRGHFQGRPRRRRPPCQVPLCGENIPGKSKLQKNGQKKRGSKTMLEMIAAKF